MRKKKRKKKMSNPFDPNFEIQNRMANMQAGLDQVHADAFKAFLQQKAVYPANAKREWDVNGKILAPPVPPPFHKLHIEGTEIVETVIPDNENVVPVFTPPAPVVQQNVLQNASAPDPLKSLTDAVKLVDAKVGYLYEALKAAGVIK